MQVHAGGRAPGRAPNSIYRQLVLGSGYTLLTMLVVRGLSLVQSIILSRVLLPGGLGVTGIIYELNLILLPIAPLGLTMSVMRRVAEQRDRDPEETGRTISTAFWAMLGSILIVSALTWLLSNWVGRHVYHNDQIAGLMRLSAALIWFSVLMEFGLSVLQGFGAIGALARLNTMSAVITTAALYPLLRYFGVYGTLLVAGIVNIIMAVPVGLQIKRILREFGVCLQVSFHRDILARLYRFSLPYLGSQLLMRPIRLFGSSLLVLTAGFTEMGYFRISQAAYNVCAMLPAAITVPLLPIIAGMHEGVRGKEVSRIMYWQSSFALVFLAAALIACPWGTQLIYGDAYHSAISIVMLMIVAAYIGAHTSLLETTLLGLGRSVPLLFCNIYSCLVFVGTALLAIHYHKGMGLGIAYLVTEIATLPVYLWMLIRGDVLGKRAAFIILLRALAGAGGLLFILPSLQIPALAWAIGSVLLGAWPLLRVAVKQRARLKPGSHLLK